MMAEDCDFVRAALCSLSNRNAAEASPVHIHRLTWYISQFNATIDTLSLLRSLQAVRESQPIPGGYWMATPTRCVPISGHMLLVSALPREELLRQWHIPLLEAGISRVVASAPIEIPVESFESWLGAPADTKRWATRIFEGARSNLQAVNLVLGELELYVRPTPSSAPAWLRGKAAISLIGNNQLVLCRHTGDAAITAPFIGRCLGARLTHQATIRPPEQRRLQWGASLLMGYRARVKLRENDDRAIFESPNLPNEEFRLLRALGSCRRGGPGTTRCELKRAYLPTVKSTLARLGMDIE
jgi:hypothetical protein